MKKIALILTLISLLFQIQDTRVKNNYDTLNKINEMAMEMDLQLEEWQDIYIEELTVDAFERMKSKLRSNYIVRKEKEEKSIKYIFVQDAPRTQNKPIVKHEIYAIMPEQGHTNMKLQIKLTGDQWNRKVKEHYLKLTKLLQKEYKMKLTTNFACAKMNDSGIMHNGTFINEIMNQLQAIHINEQVDNVAASNYEQNVYGNSTLFDQTMNINNEQINVQIAIRQKTKTKKQIILGTPLILAEY